MNSFSVFEEDDDVEFTCPTSNPLRKWKKKLRQKKQRYKKNPSPELENEIINIEKIIKKLLTPPKPKTKKFKKKKINKAEEFKKRKAKRERNQHEKYKKAMFEAQLQKWKRRRAEKMIRLQKEYLTLAKTDNYCCMHNNKKNSIPKEIKLFIKDPNKPCYNRLSRKYHPDKIALKKQLLINLLTNLPEELVDIIWSFYYNKELNELYCKIIVGFWNDLNELYISNRFNYI